MVDYPCVDEKGMVLRIDLVRGNCPVRVSTAGPGRLLVVVSVFRTCFGLDLLSVIILRMSTFGVARALAPLMYMMLMWVKALMVGTLRMSVPCRVSCRIFMVTVTSASSIRFLGITAIMLVTVF